MKINDLTGGGVCGGPGRNKVENGGFCGRIEDECKDVTKLLKKFSLCLTPPYMGHTGYSTKENVNNIKIVHLHWGLQLIFDESQKEGNNEIWIDIYPLTRFLAKHTQAAVKVEGTKEWVRTTRIVDPAVEEYEALAPDGVQVPVKDDSLENSRTESQEVEQRLE